MLKFVQHSCGDSRLTCTDCGSSVCPKCMIECPVGNRCKRCAAKTESHVLKVTPLAAIRTFAASAIATYLFTFAGPFLGGGFFAWIIICFLGVLVGNFIHRVSGFKLGPIIISTVIAGIAAGAFLNPTTLHPYGMDKATLTKMVETEMILENEREGSPQKGQNPKMTPQQELALKEQISQMETAMQTAQIFGFVRLGIWTLGILTPFTGIVLPFIYPRR